MKLVSGFFLYLGWFNLPLFQRNRRKTKEEGADERLLPKGRALSTQHDLGLTQQRQAAAASCDKTGKEGWDGEFCGGKHSLFPLKNANKGYFSIEWGKRKSTKHAVSLLNIIWVDKIQSHTLLWDLDYLLYLQFQISFFKSFSRRK